MTRLQTVNAAIGTLIARLWGGKLGFIHRRLWDSDGLYRVALLLGPAPLIGCGVAAGIWFMHRALPAPTVQPPVWGKPFESAPNWSASAQPQTAQPARPIPALEADGRLSGYESGWRVTIRPIDVSPTFNVDVKPIALRTFLLDGSNIDLALIIESGPKNTEFVAAGSGFLVVRAPGTYGLSLRFERPSGTTADCLTRLGFGSRRVVSNYWLENKHDVLKTSDAARFDLQPGLYPIGWLFGCWHDRKPVGPGRITVLISHPGEQGLRPARPEDIVRRIDS